MIHGVFMRSFNLFILFSSLAFPLSKPAHADCLAGANGITVCGSGACAAGANGIAVCNNGRYHGYCLAGANGIAVCGDGPCAAGANGIAVCSDDPYGSCLAGTNGIAVCSMLRDRRIQPAPNPRDPNRGGHSRYRCLPSSQYPGYFYAGIPNSSDWTGEYFRSLRECRRSLR